MIAPIVSNYEKSGRRNDAKFSSSDILHQITAEITFNTPFCQKYPVSCSIKWLANSATTLNRSMAFTSFRQTY
uniref:Uncharacterized protein n=1 Tax=Arundo donax TaxID=35708 RepID=A0A0A8XZ75_ARUDO